MKGIVFLSHCILNPWTKTEPCPPTLPANLMVQRLMDCGIGIVQMPCPELVWGGLKRWGVTSEQLLCHGVIKSWTCLAEDFFGPFFDMETEEFHILAFVGIKGSPSCGVDHTCYGYHGGEAKGLTLQKAYCGLGSGVWSHLCRELFHSKGFSHVPFIELDEKNEQSYLEVQRIIENLLKEK